METKKEEKELGKEMKAKAKAKAKPNPICVWL